MGFTFTSPLTSDQFTSRLINAMVHLRYTSPFTAADIQKGRHHAQLSSWVYKPPSSTAEATKWATDTLRIVHASDVQKYTEQITYTPLKDTQIKGYRQFFFCHLLLNEENQPHGLTIHASHAILDGPGALVALKLLFRSISHPPDTSGLDWSDQAKNLPPGPVKLTGGIREGWEVDLPSIVKDFEEGFVARQVCIR